MKILIFLLLLCGSVQAANLDANLMVITDLHHSQANNEYAKDEVTDNLAVLANGVITYVPAAINWLGLGDIIHQSTGEYGPFEENVADIEAVFNSAGIVFKSISDAHDVGGGPGREIMYATSFYEGAQWTWDIGEHWRVIAIETLHVYPGYIISESQISWLQSQLAQAISAGKYLIIATHLDLWGDVEWRDEVLTPSGTSGNISLTSDTSDTFSAGDIGKEICLRSEDCPTGIESCWGCGTITAVGSGTTAGVTVNDALPNTTPTSKWGYDRFYYSPISNAPYIRSLLESAGSETVKLVINGHWHNSRSFLINDIRYIDMSAALSMFPSDLKNGAHTGGLLHLYDDGSWALAGTGSQVSFNWHTFYISQNGTSRDGCVMPSDACDVATLHNKIVIGDDLYISSNISSDFNISGTSENRSIITSTAGNRYVLDGSLHGNYLSIFDIDLPTLKVISASNSIIKNVRVR